MLKTKDLNKGEIICPNCLGKYYITSPGEGTYLGSKIFSTCKMCNRKGKIKDV